MSGNGPLLPHAPGICRPDLVVERPAHEYLIARPKQAITVRGLDIGLVLKMTFAIHGVNRQIA